MFSEDKCDFPFHHFPLPRVMVIALGFGVRLRLGVMGNDKMGNGEVDPHQDKMYSTCYTGLLYTNRLTVFRALLSWEAGV